jgi:hypothetical protein
LCVEGDNGEGRRGGSSGVIVWGIRLVMYTRTPSHDGATPKSEALCTLSTKHTIYKYAGPPILLLTRFPRELKKLFQDDGSGRTRFC